ncbi:MAG: FlgO family outer membrane protein [Phycisphaerae bacterium]
MIKKLGFGLRGVAWICVLYPTLLPACAGTKTTFLRIQGRPDHAVRKIALNPSGGILADAIGMELLNRGFTVIDTQDTSNLFIRLGMEELEVMEPQQLRKLRDEYDIDAVLAVRAATTDSQLIVAASVRLISTHTGGVLGGLGWENAKGGGVGSAADHMVKKGVTDAAREIVKGLIQSAGLESQTK